MRGLGKATLWAVVLGLGLLTAGCSPSSSDDLPPIDVGGDTGTDGDSIGPPPPDADGDTISDADEERSIGTDTDGDTTPDYLDDDSDGDGISDAMEAGDADPRTAPGDADGDGIPNFRDIDSDGNGIFDAADSTGDLDGDTALDFADLDDDGDGLMDLLEIGDNPSAPPDFDGDTTPDYRDPDSDNDWIGDRDESTSDTDLDTIPDRFDDDTDGDGWSDEEEAGDMDLSTPAVDTDGDMIPDFRDPDSDGDGLADDLERIHGTDRTNPDTDGDGTDDMVEVAAGTNPLDETDNPPARGDFVFLVPYNNPESPPDPPLDPTPPRDTLVFSTNIQFADVYFLVDCTGSMGGEIANLRSSIRATVIPGIRGAITNTWIGVGHFDDLPISPYGSAGTDWGYNNLQSITDDEAAAQAGADRLPNHYGADLAESHVVAMYTVSSADHTRTQPAIPAASCPPGTWGYPCFRDGAVPILIVITDAPMHNGPSGNNYSGAASFAPSYTETIAALNAHSVRVIGVNSGSGTADLNAVAIATGAVDIGGTPLVFEISSTGTGLGAQVINAVETLASAVPMRIDAQPVDDPSDAVDAPAAFIDYLEANASGMSIWDPIEGVDRICTVTDPLPADETGDGVPDYFPRVLPGTPVCFDIVAKRNVSVPATREPQMFRATVQVLGDRITVLDEREVFFVVPPEIGMILE